MPLKRIPRLISPELLSCLAAMGHGDEILIADANFPSHAQGAKHVIHCDGSSATEVLAAIVELLPLDSFVTHQAAVMKRVDSDEDAPIIAEFQKILDAVYAKDGSKTPVQLERVERFAFYDRAKSVFVVCVTGKRFGRLFVYVIYKYILRRLTR
jgi:L-fucose mutarotase